MPDMADILPSYLHTAPQKQKYVFFQALICLSAVDGQSDDDEINFIKTLAKENGLDDMQLLTDFANEQEVIESAKIITNRHLAMELLRQMCVLAHVDEALSDKEVLFIGRIGRAMNIELEKIEQISNWVIDNIMLEKKAQIIFEEEQ